MAVSRTIKKGAELDPWFYQHADFDGDLVDFTVGGWTFSLTVATSKSATVAFPAKTTGITGLATGIRVDWATTGELNSLTAGTTYVVQLRARNSDSRDLDLNDVILSVEATNHA